MPRKPRCFLAKTPTYIQQRGHNQTLCFVTEEDFLFYLQCLERASRQYRVAVHAYALLPDRIHLLMTPKDAQGISRTMQSLGRCYVQYFNRNNRHSGALWDDRYKSSPIQPENNLLRHQIFIELAPVSAGYAQHPDDYPWTSYRGNAYGEENTLITAHASYRKLAKNSAAKQRAYRELFAQDILNTDLASMLQRLAPLSPQQGYAGKFERETGGHIKTKRPNAEAEAPAESSTPSPV